MRKSPKAILRTKTLKKNLKKRLKKKKTKYTGDFPLKKNRLFSNLSYKEKEFIYNIYLRPITKDTQAECYAKAYGIELNDYNSRNTANVNASKKLRKPNFAKMYQIIKDAHQERLQINAEKIIEEEKSIAYSNIFDYVDKYGYMYVNPNTLPERIQKAVKKFTLTTFYDVRGNEIKKWKVELWDKQSSLKRLSQLSGTDPGTKVNINSVNKNVNTTVKEITKDLSAKEAAQVYSEMLKSIK